MTGTDRTAFPENTSPPGAPRGTDASAAPTGHSEQGSGLAIGTPDSDPGVDISRLRSSLPAIATDIGMGLLFFVVARFEGLRTAALVSAGTGIALVSLQWGIRRVNHRLPIERKAEA